LSLILSPLAFIADSVIPNESSLPTSTSLHRYACQPSYRYLLI